jgi:hypothetical protein
VQQHIAHVKDGGARKCGDIAGIDEQGDEADANDGLQWTHDRRVLIERHRSPIRLERRQNNPTWIV